MVSWSHTRNTDDKPKLMLLHRHPWWVNSCSVTSRMNRGTFIFSLFNLLPLYLCNLYAIFFNAILLYSSLFCNHSSFDSKWCDGALTTIFKEQTDLKKPHFIVIDGKVLRSLEHYNFFICSVYSSEASWLNLANS